jgi:hypothetical protein
LVFSSQADLITARDYYQKLNNTGSKALFSWLFVKDNVLVQINGDLAEAKARQYEAALNKL